jgi:hypothetical protein
VASAITGFISMPLLQMGLLEAKVYVNRRNTLQDLNDRIRAGIALIPQDTFAESDAQCEAACLSFTWNPVVLIEVTLLPKSDHITQCLPL